MKHFWKRLIAGVLTLVILAGTLPVPAWAALVDNTPDQNDEILREVTAFWGDEKTAQEAMDLLCEYGLIDEEGNVLTDWSGEIYIHDGDEPRHTSVEELTALLEDETVSRDTVITVDGTEITLGGFETILEIQREIGRIRETYLQDEVPLNQEQTASLYSLYEQLSENGIQLYSTNGADELVFPSGVDQTQRVSVTPTVNMQNGGTGTITLSLDHAAKEPVTLSWRIADGSAAGTIGGQTSGTVTFAVGDTTKTLTVQNTASDERWNGNRAFEVLFSGISGALFSGDTQAAHTTVQVSQEFPLENYGLTDAFKTTQVQQFHPLPKKPENLQDFDVTGIISDVLPANVKMYENELEFLDGASTHVKFYYDDNGAALSDISFYTTFSSPEFNIKYPSNIKKAIEDGIFTEIYLNGTGYGHPDSKSERGDVFFYLNDEKINKIAERDVEASIELNDSINKSDDVFIFKIDITLWSMIGKCAYTYTFVPSLKDGAAPTVNNVTAPAGPYYAGQVVPVTVEFSEPVYGSGLTLTANNQSLTAADTGSGHFGYRQTFLYTVPENGNTNLVVTKLTGMKDIAGHTATWTPEGDGQQVLATESLKIPAFLDAVDSTPTVNAGQVTYTPAQGDQPEKTTATVTVTLDMPTDTNLRNLIGGSYAVDGGFASSVLAGSIDGGGTLIPLMLDNSSNPTRLTATVELDAKTLMDRQDFVMEFYTIDGTTHESTGLLFGRYAAFSVNKPVSLKGAHLSIQTPAGWPEGPIYANNPPEEAALTLRAVVNAPAGTTWTQTRWVSSNDKVATIDASGRVYPLGTGTVEFCLEAVNGNLAEYAGERSQSVSLTIQQGAEPYLRIPENEMTIRSGDPVTVRWASNLVQKNMEYGGANTPTSFTITVTGPNGQPVGEPYVVTYDPADQSDPALWADGSPNQSFTINGLTDTDAKGYTVTLSASADAKVPGTNRDFTAQAKVTVVSQPVSVRLTRPTSLFQTNTGTLTVNYTLDNYDSQNNAEFKLVVTDNATGLAVETIDTPNSDTGGSFTIDLANAGIQDGFRTIYDVSLQAKNTAEKDWSRDSFTLYIYDKNCLDILVQPVTKDGVTTVDVDGDKVTMSNEAWIASLTQDQILALNRDIDLQAAISINYGAHAWGEASDRIQGASENSKIAAVNYPQGAYYENIEGLPYTSYAPATQFLLSGRNNGQTVVEAIHALAGDALSSSVEVTVETLKDKLYLFQFYPVGNATLTYTNGDGVTKSHNTDENGRAAVYEASGIASDIYVEATIGGEKYLGTSVQERPGLPGEGRGEPGAVPAELPEPAQSGKFASLSEKAGRHELFRRREGLGGRVPQRCVLRRCQVQHHGRFSHHRRRRGE